MIRLETSGKGRTGAKKKKMSREMDVDAAMNEEDCEGGEDKDGMRKSHHAVLV